MLFTMTDAIEQGGPRLSQATVEALAELRSTWARDPFIQVLKYIDQNYLHAR
jgi:hypothetical protein